MAAAVLMVPCGHSVARRARKTHASGDAKNRVDPDGAAGITASQPRPRPARPCHDTQESVYSRRNPRRRGGRGGRCVAPPHAGHADGVVVAGGGSSSASPARPTPMMRDELLAVDEGQAHMRTELLCLGGVPLCNDHRMLRLHGALHTVQLADGLHSEPVGGPVLRLHDRPFAATGKHEVHSTIGRAAPAGLPYPVPMPSERVGDDLLELLPAERGEVGERPLATHSDSHATREGYAPTPNWP